MNRPSSHSIHDVVGPAAVRFAIHPAKDRPDERGLVADVGHDLLPVPEDVALRAAGAIR